MFTSKLPALIVPKTHKFLNCSVLSSCKFYHNSATLYKKKQSSENVTDSPKCREYQEKLDRCPKLTEAFRCCKPLFKKAEPKCKEQTTFDDYQEACKKIANQRRSFLQDVREKTCSVLNELNSYVETTKQNEEAQLEKLSSGNKARLSELMSLDVSLGSVKRKCVLSLNHQIRQRIETLRCDLMARTRKVKEMVECIERDALICVGRAGSLMKSCQKCKNVQALQECIKENSESATAMLDDGLKCIQERLKVIDKYKQDVMKYYNAVSAEAIKAHSRENELFTNYLDDCICVLRKKR
ncbi:uncharacterized protein LOC143216884 [Lasioglossum baleicum]|uniref:uncharacterized protein LOC143216884 n=1 Tax=Lasioglossum baleicum TaxID=434251 RepID=UPI003FCD3666